ncbi:MAG: polyketide synthase dehydratase domain-containing protein [Caldilineaceae bacterium]
MAFNVISFDAAAWSSDAGEEPPTHATGTLLTLQDTAPAAVNLAALRQCCRIDCTAEIGAFYTNLAQQEIALGASFQWLARLWRPDEVPNSSQPAEALAHIHQPAAIGQTTGYQLHPALLDACFQVAALTRNGGATDATALPFAIDALHLHRPAVGEEWWCHATQVGPQKWDMRLLDASGQLVAAIEGFIVRGATAETVRGADLWREWLYQVTWQAAPLPIDVPGEPATGEQGQGQHWLIFADTQGIGAALAERLQAAHAKATLVYPATAAAKIDEHIFAIRPTAAADYQQLLATLSPVDRVIYLWGAEPLHLEGNANLVDQSKSTCGAALLLVQELLHRQASGIQTYLITKGAQAVVPTDSVENFAQATLWGLGKVIALEYPELNCVCIDLEPIQKSVVAQQEQRFSDRYLENTPAQNDSANLGEHLYQAVLATASADQQEHQVAIRNRERYVARLHRYQCRAAVPLRIDGDGTYLITGGLGGLELLTAKWLVNQGARHLLLVGRSAPSAGTAPID